MYVTRIWISASYTVSMYSCFLMYSICMLTSRNSLRTHFCVHDVLIYRTSHLISLMSYRPPVAVCIICLRFQSHVVFQCIQFICRTSLILLRTVETKLKWAEITLTSRKLQNVWLSVLSIRAHLFWTPSCWRSTAVSHQTNTHTHTTQLHSTRGSVE